MIRSSLTRLGVVATLLVAACAKEPEQVPLEDLVIARVDGIDVKRGLFESYLRYGIHLGEPTDTEDGGGGEQATVKYSDEVHSRLLDRFLLERALAETARRDGISIGADELIRFAERTGIGAISALEEEMPLTHREYLLAYLQESLMVKHLLERRVLDKLRFSDDQAVEFYEQNIARFTEPARARLRQVRVDTLRQSRELTAAVGRKRDRDKFLAYAAKLNEAEGEEQGKDLGLWPVDKLPASFAEVVAQLQAGQVSKVFQDADGAYNMVLVEEHHAERILPFAEIRERVLQELAYQRRSAATRAFLDQVRATSVVELFPANLGFHYQPPPAAPPSTPTAPPTPSAAATENAPEPEGA